MLDDEHRQQQQQQQRVAGGNARELILLNHQDELGNAASCTMFNHAKAAHTQPVRVHTLARFTCMFASSLCDTCPLPGKASPLRQMPETSPFAHCVWYSRGGYHFRADQQLVYTNWTGLLGQTLRVQGAHRERLLTNGRIREGNLMYCCTTG
ncbi:Hypothetical predicted protein, partial [Olea europaea subsp. europaea]